MDYRPVSYSTLMYSYYRNSIIYRGDPLEDYWPDQSPYRGSDSLNSMLVFFFLIFSFYFE